MIMLKRIALLGLMVTLGAVLAAPVFAAQLIQGSVGNITAAQNTDLAGSVACRVWSVSGADTGINNNTPTCTNNRCLRTYATATFYQPGGYLCNGEGTAAYNADADNQTFYELIDGQVAAGACNHAAFYAAQGQIARSAAGAQGDFRQEGCPGATPANCFDRASTTDARATPLMNTNTGYGPNPHQIVSIGGLSPVPTVRVAVPGGCPAGQAHLTWDEPELYTSSMKNGVASPVRGVRLYSNPSPCSACPNGEVGWVAGAAYDIGAGDDLNCVNITGDTWYALTVRLTGPAGGANEVETGRVGSAGFVGANSQCVNTQSPTAVRIANMSARYAGRGTVNVNFTTGIEGGVQGYYVTRGSSPNGPFTRVSGQLNPRGDGSAYTHSDKVRTALGRTLYYSIEVVNTDGTSERSGPTAVNLPAAKKKLGAQ
jgi:hypothetical protein